VAEEEKLKLGKGVTFVRSRLKRLRQEDDTPKTLAEAMAVLEAGLVRWSEEQGVEIKGP
jgi:hypothetical protein